MKPQRYGPFDYVPINRRPRITWPNGALVALWVIPNIETFPLNEPVPGGTGKAPDIINWAPRDYGNRVGIFRLMKVLQRHGGRGTVAFISEVRDAHREITERAVTLGGESGLVMAICLHPFVIGVPHRIGALDSALGYILRHEGVWRATGSEIIQHYLASGATF